MNWTWWDTVGSLISGTAMVIVFTNFVWGLFAVPLKPNQRNFEAPGSPIVPVAVSATTAVLSSLLTCWLERNSKVEESQQSERIVTHIAVGAVSLILLSITFVFWWGPSTMEMATLWGL